MGIEIDNVADMMTDMEVVKVADMVVKIPIEDFTDVTLAKLEVVIGVADMEVDKMFIAASHSYSKFEELKEHQS